MSKVNGKELGHVLLGGIPYPCAVIPAEGLLDGYEAIMLLEDVGTPGCITRDDATTFFGAGCVMAARWNGKRHTSTGRRVFDELVSAFEAMGRPIPPLGTG